MGWGSYWADVNEMGDACLWLDCDALRNRMLHYIHA